MKGYWAPLIAMLAVSVAVLIFAAAVAQPRVQVIYDGSDYLCLRFPSPMGNVMRLECLKR